jgi:hypothetical protein
MPRRGGSTSNVDPPEGNNKRGCYDGEKLRNRHSPILVRNVNAGQATNTYNVDNLE